MCGFLLLSVALAAPALREGDVVFQRSTSAQSQAVARATHSDLTHVGVVLEHAGRLEVFEAVQPVGWDTVERWEARSVPGTFEARRLASGVTKAALERMRALATDWVGRDYDVTFEWSDERLYCSELVWKLFDRAAGVQLGVLRRLGDFDLRDPLVLSTLKRRYGDRVPVGETVVAPSDVAMDPRLLRVGG